MGGINWAAKLGGGYAPAGLAHGHGSKGARQLGIGRKTASSGVSRHLHMGAIISTPQEGFIGDYIGDYYGI